MPIPEEFGPYHYNVSLSEVLERALRGQAMGTLRTRDVLDELARQMSLPTDDLGDAADLVLWALLRILEADVEEHGPWEWIELGESRRDLGIAEKVAAERSVDDLVAAAAQFGWRRTKVKGVSTLADVPRAVRSAFAADLADRVRQLLERWTNDNVWNQDIARARRERIERRRREDSKRPV
jgi:hypothetical protein